MTYQELFTLLKNRLTEKSNIYVKMENEICQTNGFGDMGDLLSFHKAKGEWQTALNNYLGFMSFVNKQGIKPEDTVISQLDYLYL